MAGKTVDAGLRIRVETAQALAELHKVKEAEKGLAGVRSEANSEQSKATREGVANMNLQGQLFQRERNAARERLDLIRAQRAEQAKMARVMPQVTDIVTGLAGGQNPLMVAIQQGGQLRDVFGSAGEAGKALMSVFTPMRVLVGGVAAVFGTLTLAAKQGYDEQQKLARGLAATGNTAATTAGQINQYATKIADTQTIGVGAVKDTLKGLATSGQYSAQNLEAAGRAVTLFSRLTGQSTDEVIKSFGDMSGGVADFAERMNRGYNFLSAAQYNQIRAAEASGNKNEAVRLTMEALANTSEKRLTPTLGLLERSWNAVTWAASAFWNGMKRIGQDTSAEDRIAGLRSSIAKALQDNPKMNGKGYVGAWQEELKALEAKVAQEAAVMQKQAKEQEETQKELHKASSEYQAALVGLNAAAAAKILAQEQAALDRRAALVKSQHDAGLTSELQFNLDMNAIEQRRLAAQAANVKRQIEIERSRVVGTKPEEQMAHTAALDQLEAQLTGLAGQIAAKSTEALALVGADAVASAQKSGQAWLAAWEATTAQVRSLTAENQAYDVAAITDAGQRASAAVQVQLRELDLKLKEVRRKLNAGIEDPAATPGMREKLQRQSDQLNAQAEQAVARITQKTTFDAYAARFAEEKQALDILIQSIELEGNATVDAEAKKAAALDAALPKLREYVALMKASATTAAEKNAAGQANNTVTQLTANIDTAKKAIASNASQGLATMFTDIVTGAKSATDAVRDFVGNFAKYMLELINKKLAEQLVGDLLKLGMGSGSGGGGGFADFISSLFHTGGLVGSGVSGMSRAVSPLLFGLAERYHSGGIAGLKADEVPAILRRGEEVLTATDPRHRANGGGAGVMGDLNISVQVSGATGSEGQQNASAENLVRMIKGVVAEWAGHEMRPNGMLASRMR